MHIPYKSFYFIRHGETAWNKLHLIMGDQDIPLNENGLRQASEASKLLAKEAFGAIISSPRLRAKQTAEIIARHTQSAIAFDEGLSERVWGEAEGTTMDVSKSLFNDADSPAGAEQFTTFQERIIQTVAAILRKETLPLIVSHGGVFKALAHSVGHAHLGADNCVPFIFRAPEEPTHPWTVVAL